MIKKKQPVIPLKYQIMTIISFVLITSGILIFLQRYMLHQEIMDATHRCYEADGVPIVQNESLISGNYSFTCNN